MRNFFTLTRSIVLFSAVGIGCLGVLWAQDDLLLPPATVARGLPQEVDVAMPLEPTGILPALALPTSGSNPLGGPGLLESPASGELAKALRLYRDAKLDSSERKAAKDQVAESLAKLYDQNIALEEKQITQMEERLVKLREQVARRRQAKARMVELKLEMVLSQADGLGWPENDAFASPLTTVHMLPPPSSASAGGLGINIIPNPRLDSKVENNAK